MNHLEVLRAVTLERKRQEQLKSEGRFKYTCADPEMSEPEKYLALGEEMGEVARALLGKMGLAQEDGDLRTELIEVAAVAVAWAESL